MQRETTELLRARVAVDGERGEVAGALEHRQLARRAARGRCAGRSANSPRNSEPSGERMGADHMPAEPVREAERVEVGARALVLDVA